MSKWKLCRQKFGKEEYKILEGDEVTVGRGLNNTITLSSLVVSRHHCIINAKKDEVTITDLKSSNGIYVGLKKIPPNIPYSLTDEDIIGFGWTMGVTGNVNDNEKFVFKLVKEKLSVTDRLHFQNENWLELCEANMISKAASHNKDDAMDCERVSPILNASRPLKRKLSVTSDKGIKVKKDSTLPSNQSESCKIENNLDIEEHILKNELEDLDYEAFNIKQEYLSCEEPILIDSDSDIDSEQWLTRLSQSSPAKTPSKTEKPRIVFEDSSYSQLDDVTFNELKSNDTDEDLLNDLVIILPTPNEKIETPLEKNLTISNAQSVGHSVKQIDQETNVLCKESTTDTVDGANMYKYQDKFLDNEIQSTELGRKIQIIEPLLNPDKKKSRGAQEYKTKSSHSKSKKENTSKVVITTSQKEERKKKLKEIACKDKEEPDKGEPDQVCNKNSNNNINKPIVNAKITTSNRGAFLTDTVQATVKPTKRKDERKVNNALISKKELKTNHDKGTDKDNNESHVDIPIVKSTKKEIKRNKDTDKDRDVDTATVKPTKRKDERKNNTQCMSKKEIKTNHNKETDNDRNESHMEVDTVKPKKGKNERKSNSLLKNKNDKDRSEISTDIDKSETSQHKFKSTSNKSNNSQGSKLESLTKCTKPPKSEDSFSGKPISKVGPIPRKPQKKSVRFSENPEVVEFEIEPGNKLNKTSTVKTRLLDRIQQKPKFSREKIALMTILKWNPQWLHEQLIYPTPPPILAHNNPPMAIFHSFNSHSQYVQLVGDLLLMEIWEYLTQGFHKTNKQQNNKLMLRIEYLPPTPFEERYFELFNINVQIASQTPDPKYLPRLGEVLLVEFGPENKKILRFFFVHNIRQVPSPPSNKNISMFSISLYTTFTESMKCLKPGDVLLGTILAYINNELMLFEAMEYLAESPLKEAILRPQPVHFAKPENINCVNLNSQWTNHLNPSQKVAVCSSIAAALGNQPCIQMVQGPPGTGKSSVICAMVMTYFYDSDNKRQQNRDKILICATSNAAVDELVIRLLKIRQSLPKTERFRMVRVGRLEAMHARARDVSSQQLAQRDVRSQPDPLHNSALAEEISHLEAKINMWKTAANEAKDPARIAYCQDRVSYITNRINLLRASGGGEGAGCARPDRVFQAERRIIECADIVVTTLASASGNKMRGLKGRVALCIVDEAGQAIEPETLIPLTLGVTRLTLIGDPQQLPGFICSQRAKKHGLGESLFARLTSSTEHWNENNPVVLLNQQYRMHPDIADYPNRAFYASKIQTMVLPNTELPIPPYCMLGICSGDKGQGSTGANEMEAWGVSRVVAALAGGARARGLSLAVLTPYAAHRDLLRRCLRQITDSGSEVEVSTVDSAQGQERDIVVVSLARSHGLGFVADAGRMNVMLTRARHALLVCANPLALADTKNHQWKTLMQDTQRRKLYTTLPNKICQPAVREHISDEEILSCITRLKHKS